MATQDRLDLDRPVTVTSIDEVGDLTAALGKLRTWLEAELAGYRDALATAREADRTKNEFFATVSHELRTPLTTLCGFAQLLLDGSEGDLSSSQREDIASILRGGRQLLDLVNDVLDISVIETGTVQLAFEQVDLGPLCRQVAHAQRAILDASALKGRVELVVEIEDELPTIDADPRRLTQIVQNLLSNAMKFTAKGSIRLQVRREGPDTGEGIGGVDLPHVFDHYRQAGDLQTRRAGSGLGLAICKRLTELHHGSIAVESEVGRGSTFTVTLPRARPGQRTLR